MDYIVSWFYSESEEMKSKYPQVNADSTSDKFQEVYWRCIVSFYTSSLNYNSNKKHIFYTNLTKIPDMNNFNLKSFFDFNNIEVRNINLSTKAPEDWNSAWRNQFYVFDILSDLQEQLTKRDNLLILDSDCIVTKNLDELFKDIDRLDAIVYDCGYADDHNINGISPNQMRALFSEYYQVNDHVKYYGGEFIAVNGDVISKILKEYKSLWDLNYKKYEQKLLKLTEEAHFLSFIYHRLHLTNSLGNKYIKRLWNGRSFNNIEESDVDLAIYHLPSQKTTGFKYFFRKSVVKGQTLSRDELVNIFDIKKKKRIIRRVVELSTKIMFRVAK